MAVRKRNPDLVRNQDLSGRRYGRLVVLALSHTKDRNRHWRCVCDCGNETTSPTTKRLRSGHTASCGCLSVEAAKSRATHGEGSGANRTPEYLTWASMIGRCTNPKYAGYHNYGGRGITVDPAWRESYEEFLAHVGRKPSRKHSLDRIDNSKGYEPGNVRWASKKQQMRNTRHNKLVEFNGERFCLADWAERLGFNYFTLFTRLEKRKWSIEKTLTTPLGPSGRKKK